MHQTCCLDQYKILVIVINRPAEQKKSIKMDIILRSGVLIKVRRRREIFMLTFSI